MPKLFIQVQSNDVAILWHEVDGTQHDRQTIAIKHREAVELRKRAGVDPIEINSVNFEVHRGTKRICSVRF